MQGIYPPAVAVQTIPNPKMPLRQYISECIRLGLKPSQAFYHWFQANQMAFGLFRMFMRGGGKDLIGELVTPQGMKWLREEGNLEDFFGYLLTISR